MNSTMKNLFFLMVSAVVIFLFWSVSVRIQKDEVRLGFSDFLTEVEAGNVAHVAIQGQTLYGGFANGQEFITVAPLQAGESLLALLRNNGVDVVARDQNTSSVGGHIIAWAPIIIMIAYLALALRREPASAGTSVWSDAKLGLLYHLAGHEPGRSVEELVSLSSVAPPTLRRVLYEMVTEGTIVLTADKTYRLRRAAPND